MWDFAPQPMREEHLLTGALKPTNAPYAIAKVAGIKPCKCYNRQYGSTHGCTSRVTTIIRKTHT